MKESNFRRLVLMVVAGGMIVQSAVGITIDTVYVGGLGNANDPTTGFGAVNYGYSVGRYEVTLNQYTAFLNAVGAADPYGLYNTAMGSNPNIMGIARSGLSGGYTYSVIGSGDRPVTYVSWYDSVRFVNWLHNGQPAGAQAAGTTETGAYTLNGAMSGVVFRNADATFALPTENEWYKAAYHQPALQGGDSDDYWLYPTANNTHPNSLNGSLDDPNCANVFLLSAHGYAVTQSAVYSPNEQYLTDVGAFRLADSYYGLSIKAATCGNGTPQRKCRALGFVVEAGKKPASGPRWPGHSGLTTSIRMDSIPRPSVITSGFESSTCLSLRQRPWRPAV